MLDQPPAAPVRLRIMTVCTGNICRSPMAEAIIRAAAASVPSLGPVVVDSCGLYGYHIGQDADRRALQVLAEGGYPITHRARRMEPGWLGERELILAMDAGHLRELQGLAARQGVADRHIRLMREFDPEGPGDVADPYYDTIAEFREVRTTLERCLPALLEHLGTLGSPAE